MDTISFDEALSKAKKYTTNKKPTLLLGNGFSVALFPKIFSYNNLLIQADNQKFFDKISPAVRVAFEKLNTTHCFRGYANR